MHKWTGLAACFFIVVFCVSGVLLNHRRAIAGLSVSRGLLPSVYRFQDWNNGLLRGTLVCDGRFDCGKHSPDSAGRVLVYGAGGVFLVSGEPFVALDSLPAGLCSAVRVTDFNDGLPCGADMRNIRSMARAASGTLYALSPFGLFMRGERGGWSQVALPNGGERLSDMVVSGDSVIVVGRSCLYVSGPGGSGFRRVVLRAPAGHDGTVSLFRTVWMLHSGELFGLSGRLVMDLVAVVLVVLCITGVAYWLLLGVLRRGKGGACISSALKKMRRVHDYAGRKTLYLLLLVVVTGWSLRPPVMIGLLSCDVPAVPFTSLDSGNPWTDKLRMLRRDDVAGDWMLSTSEGFYSLKEFGSVPEPLREAPAVSVMGLNVLEREPGGNRWLAGSFSGMYLWDRSTGRITDRFTGDSVSPEPVPPFGKHAVSGYSADICVRSATGEPVPTVVEYDNGTSVIGQPECLSTLPMSLWNVALEAHTGRIYTSSGVFALLFIFVMGILAAVCLWSGRRRR